MSKILTTAKAIFVLGPAGTSTAQARGGHGYYTSHSGHMGPM